jgi:hypothetical protein
MPANNVLTLPVNIGPCHWSTPDGGWGSFRPKGPLYIVTVADGLVPNPDPSTWRQPGKRTLSARLFVGFNVRGKPRWKDADLIRIVREVRATQGRPADSSFLSQKGIYTSQETGKVEVENGAQVVIINLTDDSLTKFTNDIAELAEVITRTLKQETVIAEIQRGGVVLETLGTSGSALSRPRKRR